MSNHFLIRSRKCVLTTTLFTGDHIIEIIETIIEEACSVRFHLLGYCPSTRLYAISPYILQVTSTQLVADLPNYMSNLLTGLMWREAFCVTGFRRVIYATIPSHCIYNCLGIANKPTLKAALGNDSCDFHGL